LKQVCDIRQQRQPLRRRLFWAGWRSRCRPKVTIAPPTLWSQRRALLLPIDFVLVKSLWICWFPRLRFCGRCERLGFTISITITITYWWL